MDVADVSSAKSSTLVPTNLAVFARIADCNLYQCRILFTAFTILQVWLASHRLGHPA
jgi:hypothetical protein